MLSMPAAVMPSSPFCEKSDLSKLINIVKQFSGTDIVIVQSFRITLEQL